MHWPPYQFEPHDQSIQVRQVVTPVRGERGELGRQNLGPATWLRRAVDALDNRARSW